MPHWKLIHWSNTLFLSGTLLGAVVGVPLYIHHFGLDLFQILLFAGFFAATGLSITLGYHRLFSHRSFQASWPVRLATLLFGAAAFENSALVWCADHRRHHKHTDHDDDPYDISKGFFHAHIGWILFRLQADTPLTWVKDLQNDRLAMWQHNHYKKIAVGVGFLLPSLLGGLIAGWPGALGAFLMAGLARVVFVHHMTFFINSLCHTLGRQPYSSRCSARDSGLMAWLTLGEGYHNFHHEFQHDYRNGAKPWQFDPTKWSIWLLHKLGLVRDLRRATEEKILLAQLAEQQRQFKAKLDARPVPLAESIQHVVESAQQRLHQAALYWEQLKTDYRTTAEERVEASRERMHQLQAELHEATVRLRAAWRDWKEAQSLALAQTA